ICARTSGNVIIETGIMHVRQSISEGKNMAEPLAATGVFPDMVVQMIAVGEQTGALDQMLNKIADFYEEETDVAVAALTSALEPRARGRGRDCTGRTGGREVREGFCCSCGDTPHGDCAVSLRRCATPNPKILASRTSRPPVLL